MKFEKVKDRISLRLINPRKTKYPVGNIPHTDFLDLTFIYYIIIRKDEDGIDTLLITNEDMKHWNMRSDELHRIALENFNEIFRMRLYGPVQPAEKICMITTNYQVFGAAYMADLMMIGTFADVFDDDLCIIPSSMHEIIIVPAAGIEREHIDMMIREVNRQMVEDDEYLSDHMYLFSRKSGQISY